MRFFRAGVITATLDLDLFYLMDGNPSSSRLSKRTIDVPEQGEIELVKLFSVPPAVNHQTMYMAKGKVAVPAPEPTPNPQDEVRKVAIRPPQPALREAAANANEESVLTTQEIRDLVAFLRTL
jgi:hypothetical protein